MDDDQDEYDGIADEDLIGAFNQPSQTLPPLLSSSRPQKRQRRSQDSNESGHSGNEEDDKRKKKYRIHIAERDVPAAKIVGATQAEALPNHDYSRELDDLPSDAFSSPEYDAASKEPTFISSSSAHGSQGGGFRSQRLDAPQQGLRQTTLFGGRASYEAPASQAKKAFSFRVDKPPEAPTQHALDREALKTWVYPTNLGNIRDYQFSIVKHGLFNNLLVALPTGLGKTFIAATIMYNFFRWTKDAQIVFVAPTKPLVAQQVKACFSIVGIPRSQTTMLTGEQPPALRAEEWNVKRVFFMTPQTLHNDLTSGIADPKKIALLVVDEAHRATGKYAYCTVVTFLRRFNQSFRVLALTATPGASVEAIQEVIDNLEISKVEIRTEESIDIQQFVHRRNIDQVIIDPSDEIIMVKELFSKALQPLLNQLCAQNAYYNKDPMSLTTFGLLQARTRWMADAGRNANIGLKGMMIALFAILSSLAHSIKLLNFHGIGPFYQVINAFRTEVEDGRRPSKYKSQVIQSPDFVKMMDRIRLWLSKDDFVGHPKLTYLCDTILNHFLDAGEGRLGEDAPPSSTRAIVFAEFRDSAEEICRVLNKHGPMIRSSVFVGQADSKRSEGMNQTKQQETIDAFKAGKFNVLVATSIGEEGLDIGQVDLIVCFDASCSPIRMLQRMGRTGRKRAGHIVLLLMRGKEEDAFAKAKDNYEQMQKMISSGERFEFRHDLSVRIVPRDITPVVDKRKIEIPFENTQDPERLPEPKRRATKGRKKPAKKFHMPDDVETGFRKASKLTGRGGPLEDFGITAKQTQEAPKNILAPLLLPESVFLDSTEEKEFVDRYINVCGNESQEVSVPDLCSHTSAQRSLGPAVNVPHGHHTLRCVTLFRTLAKSQSVEDRYVKPFGDVEPSRSFWDPPCLIEDQVKASKPPVQFREPALAKTQPPPKAAMVLCDIGSDSDDNDPSSSARRAQRVRDGFCSDSEGLGDIIHSEDRSEDDSDLGSLQDFIADGTQLPSSHRRPGMRRSSNTPPRFEQTLKPFFVPTQFANTQDEDDDMPDLQTLVGKKAEPASKVSVRSDSDEEEGLLFQAQHRRRRRVVADSDSDE
ncbi:hypothetical protein PZA11_001661 [Diplocarpon coronariae]